MCRGKSRAESEARTPGGSLLFRAPLLRAETAASGAPAERKGREMRESPYSGRRRPGKIAVKIPGSSVARPLG
jgi:hypothetical protein